MELTRRVLCQSLGITGLMLSAPRAQAVDITALQIASDGDELAFKPTLLTCRTGTLVRLSFHHAGEIIHEPHSWVLLKPGTERTFIADSDKEQDPSVVVPHGDEGLVLAASPLCALGETVTVDFIAPIPGRYPFVCSIPGHGESMRGTLLVTT